MKELKTPFTLFDVFTACLGTYCPACGRGGLQMDDIPSHSSRKSSNTSSSSTSSSWKTPKTEFASPRHTSYRRPPHQIRTNKPKSKSRSRSPSPPISVKHTTLTESRSQSSVASSPLAAQLNAFLHS